MTHLTRTQRFHTRTASTLLLALITSACSSSIYPPLMPRPLQAKLEGGSRDQLSTTAPVVTEKHLEVKDTPLPPAGKAAAGKMPAPQAPISETADITLMFDQIPLPTFVQVVYGNILKKNFSLDPQIASRQDLVTLRTSLPQTPSQVESASRMLLKSYGIAVNDLGGFYQIVPDKNLGAYSPIIRRGRALPDTPLPLRPIYQLVELQAVRQTDVSGWIKQMFGGKIQLLEDPSRNAVLISGQTEDVTAALEAIHVLDQPLMRGRVSARITPAYWSSEELAKKVADLLIAEGYSVSSQANGNTPIVLLPIQAINSIIAFAADKSILEHVVKWSKELDNPSSNRSSGGGYFTYPVKYTDAQDLAKTLTDLMSGAAASDPKAPAKKTGRVVVNTATNSLIIQGSAEEYTQWIGLLKDLDRPTKAAMIEVTVAEVRLTDKQQLGVEWELNPASVNGGSVIGGTLGGLGVGTGGLTLKYLDSAGQTKAILNAMASTARANILSTPRILARNGEAAQIQVGQEVPVVTSQQSTGTTSGLGGTPNVLQTIQYRNTGVILKVRPIIHAGGRIELEVAQEVSSASETKTGVNVSPTFSTRRVDTKLSLRDGATVVLGGLMSQNQNNSDTGIPLLKDIPVLGQLFRTNVDNTDKTELIVMITPYVINDDYDAQALSDAFRDQMGEWAQYRPEPNSTKAAAKTQSHNGAIIAPAVMPPPTPPAVAPMQATTTPPAAATPNSQTTPTAPADSSGTSTPAKAPVAPETDMPAGVEFSRPTKKLPANDALPQATPAADIPSEPPEKPSPASPSSPGNKGKVVTDINIINEIRKLQGLPPLPAAK